MSLKCIRSFASLITALTLTVGGPGSLLAQPHHTDADDVATKTPIKHLVVIFQENISFDHYFATYPHATNPTGEPAFHAKDDTPRVNNLLTSGLLHDNPNSSQPFRLDRSQAVTCDQDHDYNSEQKAFDQGLMDMFPEMTGEFNTPSTVAPFCNDLNGTPQNMVMGYYDGNTVTALWNYAQHFAMSDNSYSTNFGPSTVGALNLVAGNTATGHFVSGGSTSGNLAGGGSDGAVVGDPRPAGDVCNPTGKTYVSVSGTGSGGTDNVGDLLNKGSLDQKKPITWGWFQGGFKLAGCNVKSPGLGIVPTASRSIDYIAHHEPFQYFASTQNPGHLPPTGKIGKTDQANHQYDLSDFWTAVNNDNLPAVSFLKAPGVQDGHPGYSDPLDEQFFVVDTINKLQKSDEWKETAVIVLYDDSDGWYDHQMSPIVSQSASSGDDFLTDPTGGTCGKLPTSPTPNGRCGRGPRQPLLVVSPWARENYVDHRITDQSSVLRFIEDNWNLGRLGGFSNDAKTGTLDAMFDFDDKDCGGNPRKLILDPIKGTVVSQSGSHHNDKDYDSNSKW